MPEQPEILNFPRHPAVSEEPQSFLPQFPTVATILDRFARRIPWWVWVTGTVTALWWFGRKKKSGT